MRIVVLVISPILLGFYLWTSFPSYIFDPVGKTMVAIVFGVTGGLYALPIYAMKWGGRPIALGFQCAGISAYLMALAHLLQGQMYGGYAFFFLPVGLVCSLASAWFAKRENRDQD